MKDLQVFNNSLFGEVRFIEVEGKPYAIGIDIARALGYSNASKAVSTHCKNGIKEMISHSQNGNVVKTLTTLISEGDIYRLIVKSKLPQAEKFESWVFDEVLPLIRKDGGYIIAKEEDTDEEIMARALLIAQSTIERKNEKIKALENNIKVLEPKAEVYDAFVEKEGTFGFRELRKELESALGKSIKETELKEIIRNKGWIGSTVKALAYAIRNGYMVSKDIEDKFGLPRVQDRFTMKAREELLKHFKGIN